MKFEPKPPDYRIAAQTLSGKKVKGNIGAAWVGESGRIFIHLDPFVTISGNMEIQITMFPNDKPI